MTRVRISGLASVRLLALAGALSAASCATRAAPARLPAAHLESTDGHARDFPDAMRGARFTVLEFFSAHCPVQSAHDARLRALASDVGARGVTFFAVDSEIDASVERDRAEAAARGFTFPILVDTGARLADALGVDYATYTVIVDQEGRVRYRGGLDDDKTHLRDDAAMYVKDALEDLLAGREPRIAEGKTLGCALRKR